MPRRAATTDVPTAEQVRAFTEEFGFEPVQGDSALRQTQRELELQIINGELQLDRAGLRQLNRQLGDLRRRAATTRNLQERIRLHGEMSELIERLSQPFERYLKRIELAKKFGFKPDVYRGAVR